MEKRCCQCDESKPLEAFAINRSKPDGRHNQCRACKKVYNAAYYEQTKDRHNPGRAERRRQERVRIRRKLIEYLQEHPCIDCGETDILVLQFDHQGDKLFDIGAGAAKLSSWTRVEREIAKCEVVCANDHQRRTARKFGWHKLKHLSAAS
ncbi:hypothetical protein AB0K00_46690 [Dactylosporangium sp. NPDC049525]|uniref:hypothetical protein n=1 Tax=Dactylosporangium sp. NPDC049525 TaxID=3154730 RepID=UPI0034348ED9